MLTKSQITAQSEQLGFADIGFTTAESFDSQKEVLHARKEAYSKLESRLQLMKGTDPRNIMPEAKSIIVLLESYFRESFPAAMEAHFGRCYQDDDRKLKEGLSKRVKAFREYLHAGGIESKVPFNLPHRLAAARAGMGTFGKNCLFYSNKVAAQGSWVLLIALVIDREFEPGEPTLTEGCPDWCKNACIVACPTGALKGSRNLDPRRCISYMTYYSTVLTPQEFREPMGLWVYGCDRCQNVCPRNAPWLSRELPVNPKVVNKSKYFELPRLLHMDKKYYETYIWPHMFYISSDNLWLWKMNVARVMGNSLNQVYVPDLIRAFKENQDERVKGMIEWALEKIRGRP